MKILLSLAVFLLLAFSAFAVDRNGDFAELNGQKVHFKSFGKGKKAIVFVHGWTCNSEFWRDSYNSFPDYRVIAVDLIGHGRSDKPKSNYTMEYFAQSIDAVLKKAKVKKAVLIGHSMGTPVIRQFYRLYPKKTIGLVIVDGALRPFAPKAQIDQFMAPLRANYMGVAPTFIEGLAGNISPKLKTFVMDSMLSTPEHVALSAMDGMGDENLYKTDKIGVPVLAVLADSSFGQQKDLEEFLRGFIPNLDLKIWKDVSHFLMMEKPQEFNSEVKAFISKNKML